MTTTYYHCGASTRGLKIATRLEIDEDHVGRGGKENLQQIKTQILNTGEVPNLYNMEDKSQILDMCAKNAQADGKLGNAAVFAWYVDQCKRYLHITLCTLPLLFLFSCFTFDVVEPRPAASSSTISDKTPFKELGWFYDEISSPRGQRPRMSSSPDPADVASHSEGIEGRRV